MPSSSPGSADVGHAGGLHASTADIQYPYTEGAARLRVLYRLHDAPEPKRLLIVAASSDDEQLAEEWEGGVTFAGLDDGRALLDQDGARYDAIALPAVLGVTSSAVRGTQGRWPNAELLKRAGAALAPGGLVVGHMTHGRALRGLARADRSLALAAAALSADGITGAMACRRALARAGFQQAECYYVQPTIADPMALIPSDAAASRAHFLRAVRSSRGGYSLPGYAARIALARLGLAGLLQSDLFFWARKPC
ncbi:MAG: hypothetical protein JSR59_03485 [Proteobacteria bacterium]|nr:hypothetical protein [Pseudomonadota bacterium]